MAREFFDKMPKNKDIMAWNMMINAYLNDGQMSEAHRLFDSMPAKDLLVSGIYPDITTLIGVLVIYLFERMHHRNVVTWTMMVAGLAQNGRVPMVREFLDRMMKNKDITTWNAMNNAYANDGQTSDMVR
ncbi:pentatricopeptide repeat-containing protein At5g39350-like [Lolium perenne]|uniref:pentatricopeptide repeat-containing protein At5g39350-like n=1 Tax=Lolium perenne TaxID=4522 RepID=UPI0021F5AF88|nr:pentatricopeptide repeat-containing protein At2g35030, mitochondrial-like [Lolium perenne]